MKVIDKYGNLKTATTTTTVAADGDFGDITISSSGTVYTVDPGVITASKLASTLDMSSIAVTVRDDNFIIVDNADATKKIIFEASGITTGTTRTLTAPNADGTIALTSNIPSVFGTIAVSGQSDVVADTTTDTLTLVAGTNITITTDAAADSITINSSGGGGLSDGDKGDVTVSSSGAVWTIDNDAVTYAKIQDVSATDRLLGRDTAGAGVIEELTVSGGLEFTGTGIQRSALTGDVTATAGSNSTTIANAAVTATKLATTLDMSGITVTLQDNNLTIQDNVDLTKKLAFQLSGITTATTRTLTAPDASGTIALTSDLSSYQPLDATLTAVAAYNTNGLLTQTASDTFTGRTITGTSNEVAVSNGDGVSGNPTLSLPSTLALRSKTVQLQDSNLTISDNADATKLLAFECSGITTATTRTLTVPDASGTIALTSSTQPLDATLTALAAYNTNGLLTQTSSDTFVGRTVTGTTNEVTVTNGDGVSGNPTLSLSSTLALRSKTVQVQDNNFTISDNSDATKLLAFECSGITTATTRTLTVPNASTTIVGTDVSQTLTNKTISGSTNTITVYDSNFTLQDNSDATKQAVFQASGITTATTRTYTLPNADGTIALTASTQPLDATLTALAAYNTNGVLCQTSSDTFVGRTITGTTNEITVTNGDGVSGNPALSLPSTLALRSKTVQLQDNNVTLVDNADNTKVLAFECSGITTGTTRTLTAPDASGTIALTSNLPSTFSTIAVSGQSDVVADSSTDTLTLAAGSNITITTNASTDTVTISATGGGTLGDGDYGDITVSGSGTVMNIDAGVVGATELATTIDAASSNFTFQDNNFRIKDNADTSKVVDFQCSGITTATTRTLTIPDASGTIALTSNLPNSFSTIVVSGQSDVVADSTSDSLTLVAGSNITITTNAGSDSVTIAATGGGTLGDGDYGDITVSGSGTVMNIDAGVVGATELATTIDAAAINFTFQDNNFRIKDNTDTSKVVDFQCSGITTATTRTLTIPNASGTIALTSDLSSYQPLDATLTALAAYGTNGILTQTASDTFTGRTITGTTNEITLTNGDGVSGNPTVSLPSTLALRSKAVQLQDSNLTISDDGDSTKLLAFQCSNITTGTTRTLTVPNASGTIALTSDLSSYQPLDSTLTAVAAYNTNGLLTQTSADTFTGRTITGTSNEITVTNGDGVSGNPTLSLPATIDLGGKTSLEIPNSATPTVDADGEIAIDTTIADMSHGLIKYYSGEECVVVAMPVAQLTGMTDGYVVTYDGTADEFKLAAGGGGGGGLTHPQVMARVFIGC